MKERGNAERLDTRQGDERVAARERGDETAKRTYVTVPDQEGILVCDGEVVVDVIYGH